MAQSDGVGNSDVAHLNLAEDAQTGSNSLDVDKIIAESSSVEPQDANSADLSCLKCGCLILRKGVGCFHKAEFTLPQMDNQPSRVPAADSELITDFWTVDDMFKFENVGFSNTVEHVKYLVCADCEAGPIGWQDIRHKVFYVACKRVAQQ